jgi:DNA invertase Pin-like site-specific DNA recombinase
MVTINNEQQNMRRKHAGRPKKLNEELKDKIVEAYNNAVSINEICSEFHVSTTTVYRVFHERGFIKTTKTRNKET